MPKNNFNVGDLVQYTDDTRIFDCVLDEIVLATAPVPEGTKIWRCDLYDTNDFLDVAKVTLEDGSKKSVNLNFLTPRDSSLEREFRLAETEASRKIDEYLDQARSAINSAVEISEQYGIPFSSSISEIGQRFTPQSFSAKFEDLDQDFLDSFDIYVPGYSGWEHSAVC
jgi:hypothetical protein